MELHINSYRSQTSNGINTSVTGSVKANPAPKTADSPAEILTVQGSFEYVGDDGVTYSVRYTADENGFQPQVSRLEMIDHLSLYHIQT